MLSIYIHIPFCKKKCNYCDFNSFSADEETVKAYKNRLVEEISSSVYKGEQADTVFIGGGTPSLMPAKYIEEILCAVNNSFPIANNAEITLEANPESVLEEKLSIYKAAGINRLSMGVQAFNNSCLKTLGRIHSKQTALNAYELIQKTGFKNINIDLMFFYPNQTLEDWEQTLNTALSLNPAHISAYSLILEEGTLFYKKYKNYQTNDELYRIMYQRTKEILQEKGLYRYEISNFAKKGRQCRHNITYWRRYNYLGFGISAHSMYNNIRFSNTESISDYIAGVSQINKEILTKNDCMGEFMFLGMRMMSGVDNTLFKREFGMDMFEYFKQPIQKYLNLGLLAKKGSRLCLTDEGINVSNTIFSEFI